MPDKIIRTLFRTRNDDEVVLEVNMSAFLAGNTPSASSPLTFEAFGEYKTLPEWLRDARCKVGGKTVSKRIFRGWTLERSLSRPSIRDRAA